MNDSLHANVLTPSPLISLSLCAVLPLEVAHTWVIIGILKTMGCDSEIATAVYDGKEEKHLPYMKRSQKQGPG